MSAQASASKIEALIAHERLPSSFRATIDAIYVPLANRVAALRQIKASPCIIGLCGPQGSGKSTGAAVLRLLLEADGLAVALLSLDDLYLTRAERHRLAETIHPLLATRGPPGSHDVALGHRILDSLIGGTTTHLPAFDKATDDRRTDDLWAVFEGVADIVIFEGWCVGARPEPPDRLAAAVNDLERTQDADGVWRRYVNARLADYQALFSRIDYQVLLASPSFEVVAGWRREQEAKLRARHADRPEDLHIMTDGEVDHFVQHYERLTRHIIREMPGRADAVVELTADRALRGLRFTDRGDV